MRIGYRGERAGLWRLRLLCKDTFFRGAFAGVVGGLLKDIVSLVLLAVRIVENAHIQLHAVVAFNRRPRGFIEGAFGFFFDLIFSGFIGLLYSLLVRAIKTRHHLLLGFFTGSMVWFFVKALILAFDIDKLQFNLLAVQNPIINWLLSALYGVVVAFLDRKLSPPLEST